MDFLKLRQGCEARDIPIISPNTEKFLIDILKKKKPHNIIEIGSAVGYSGLVMANTISKRRGKIYSFEISNRSFLEALNNRKKFKIWNIYFYNFDFLKVDFSKLCSKKTDFVFIDGMKRNYKNFLIKALQYIQKGKTTIIFDDVLKYKSKLEDLYKFLEKNQIKYQIKKLDQDDGVLIIEGI